MFCIYFPSSNISLRLQFSLIPSNQPTIHPSHPKDKMFISRFRTRLLFVVLHVYTVVLLASSITDPELEQRRRECKVQQQFDEEEKRECIQRCERYGQEKQQRQREEGRTGDPSSYPQMQDRICLERCQWGALGWFQEKECRRQCEKPQQKREEQNSEKYAGREEEEQDQRGQERPYVFEQQHFTTKFETQHGRVRLLPKFTERSELFKGIENYRFSILEVEPLTFVLPKHWDAEAVVFVAQGKGTISLICEDNRESFDIREGDIVRVPAGYTTYMINRDNNEKLIMAKLLQPVSNRGHCESFFGAGGGNPKSFFWAFSLEVLEAAFKTKRDTLQRIFGVLNQGVFIKASEVQIESLSHHEEGVVWPSWEGSKGAVNIFKGWPVEENEYGKLYKVDLVDYRRLRDLDIAISFINISKGGMSAPAYNSRATKISLVISGKGHFEMACPHLSPQGQLQRQQQWGAGSGSQSVRALLRRGVVVVIPPGHPFVAVASDNQNLGILSFVINADGNEKFTLAGKRNVISQLEKEANELAFGVPAREVEEVFNSQKEEFFFKGPRQHQQEARADA